MTQAKLQTTGYMSKLVRALTLLTENGGPSAQDVVPPELDLLNDLVSAATAADRAAIMAENSSMMSEDLIALVDALRGQAESANQKDLSQKLGEIGRELAAALPQD